jgi:hypothetical protein
MKGKEEESTRIQKNTRVRSFLFMVYYHIDSGNSSALLLKTKHTENKNRSTPFSTPHTLTHAITDIHLNINYADGIYNSL